MLEGQGAAGLVLVGVLLNRLNVAIIAFKPAAAMHYVPSWMEIEVTLALIALELVIFRWVVNRMPVLAFEEAEAHVERPATRAGMAAA